LNHERALMLSWKTTTENFREAFGRPAHAFVTCAGRGAERFALALKSVYRFQNMQSAKKGVLS